MKKKNIKKKCNEIKLLSEIINEMKLLQDKIDNNNLTEEDFKLFKNKIINLGKEPNLRRPIRLIISTLKQLEYKMTKESCLSILQTANNLIREKGDNMKNESVYLNHIKNVKKRKFYMEYVKNNFREDSDLTPYEELKFELAWCNHLNPIDTQLCNNFIDMIGLLTVEEVSKFRNLVRKDGMEDETMVFEDVYEILQNKINRKKEKEEMSKKKSNKKSKKVETKKEVIIEKENNEMIESLEQEKEERKEDVDIKKENNEKIESLEQERKEDVDMKKENNEKIESLEQEKESLEKETEKLEQKVEDLKNEKSSEEDNTKKERKGIFNWIKTKIANLFKGIKKNLRTRKEIRKELKAIKEAIKNKKNRIQEIESKIEELNNKEENTLTLAERLNLVIEKRKSMQFGLLKALTWLEMKFRLLFIPRKDIEEDAKENTETVANNC